MFSFYPILLPHPLSPSPSPFPFPTPFPTPFPSPSRPRPRPRSHLCSVPVPSPFPFTFTSPSSFLSSSPSSSCSYVITGSHIHAISSATSRSCFPFAIFISAFLISSRSYCPPSICISTTFVPIPLLCLISPLFLPARAVFPYPGFAPFPSVFSPPTFSLHSCISPILLLYQFDIPPVLWPCVTPLSSFIFPISSPSPTVPVFHSTFSIPHMMPHLCLSDKLLFSFFFCKVFFEMGAVRVKQLVTPIARHIHTIKQPNQFIYYSAICAIIIYLHQDSLNYVGWMWVIQKYVFINALALNTCGKITR